jgi:DNA-binding NarL/FixJ family response regulator
VIRILIASPTPAMRAGLRSLLAGDDLEVAGEQAAVGRLAAEVDVVVLGDAALLDGAARLDLGEGRVALVVLAEDGAPAAALRALPLAGWALVSPEAGAAELQAAVRAAAQGLAVVPRALAGELLGPARPVADDAPPEALTAREQQVLELLSQGLSNKQIASALAISEHTVKFHVSALYAKLGATSRADAVSKAARFGLITL